MKASLDNLLFITHRSVRYSYLQSVKIALAGGCRDIQLRMKDAAPDEIEKTAREALHYCVEQGARLYIDDYVQVCLTVGAAGVHLGKADMPPEEARHILGNGFVIGGTANTFDDIMRLRAAGVDYIGLGPFRFTTTKRNLSPVLGLDGYKRLMEQCRQSNTDLPVVAIGGITATDIPAIMQTGVCAIALSSAIMTAEDPVATTKKIIETIQSSVKRES